MTGLNLYDFEMHPYAQPVWARWLEFGLILAALGGHRLWRRWSGAGADAGRGEGMSCTKV